MRIAMIGPFGLRAKGTMSVRALPMAQALVRRGHAVKMLLPPWDCPQDAGRTWQTAGVEIENISLPASVPLLFHINTTHRLVRRAREYKPDVIHCFKPKAYSGLSAWWLWQMKRIGQVKARLIVDTDDWEGAGGWNDMRDQGSGIRDQSLEIRERYSWAQKKMFAWQEQWGLRHNDGVTVASRALQSIVWSMGVRRDKVVYVPNGIRNVEFGMRNEEFRNPHSAIRILLYTRFFEFKVARVIEVLRRVIEQLPDAKLLVVGKGFFGEEDELLKQAATIGLGDRIEYAGWVEVDRLPEAFARTSVAIYPFDDTLINRTKCAVKLIDLLAAGVPVVADAVGQNVEYIQHNETGVVVPCGDVEAMAQAVIELLRDPDRAARLGAGAARGVRERFSWDRWAEIVERLYRSVE
jgi:glycosyltransferase involved in cell wall biosynthesis